MKYMKLIFIFLFIAGIAIAGDQRGTIHVKVTGLKNAKGWVVCHMFNNEDGYPTKSKKAMKYINDYDLKDGVAEFYFKDLPYGDYAFTVHHDENANKKMDTNFLGLPDEGWACSNNAMGFIGVGPPSFDDAKITLKSSMLTSVVEMNY